MNNDLISREALRKKVSEHIQDQKAEDEEICGRVILNIIDNAPTVEERPKYILKVKNLSAEDKKRFQEEWNKSAGGLLAIPDDYEIIPIERPQGEWIYNDYGNGCGNWHCSKCDHIPYYATKYMRFLNFCPNCGANMRGELE